ncbi:hypothetical protein ABW21_db0208971 [Orbilia brochopaga]|nr:hypothetical protein ABW21_db0208971 [Drechslerella brochopaga]
MSHHDMSMDGMDMGGSSSTNSTTAHGMGMVFQWVLETPLYSNAFTPSNTGQYVGAIFFLIVLSFLHRGIIAYASHRETAWKELESRRKIVIATPSNGDDHDDKTSLAISSREEISRRMPWRWQVDAIRALLSTVKTGVHYLLMLAVMSLNVGYFFAVLIGVFLGDIVFARYGH